METWYVRIKQARIEKGYSRKFVADQLGITCGCYAHYEQGVREPSIELIKRICEVLDISADYLIGLTDNY